MVDYGRLRLTNAICDVFFVFILESQLYLALNTLFLVACFVPCHSDLVSCVLCFVFCVLCFVLLACFILFYFKTEPELG